MRVIGNDLDRPRRKRVVASGAITKGDPVTFSTTNGTYSKISNTTESLDKSHAFYTSSFENEHITYDKANNRFVAVFTTGTSSVGQLYVAVGQYVLNSGIAWGIAVPVETNTTSSTWVYYDSYRERVVLLWTETGGGYARVGAVQASSAFNDSITFANTKTLIDTVGVAYSQVAAFDESTNKALVVFNNTSGGSYTSYVSQATVDGSDAISFTAKAQWTTADIVQPDLVKAVHNNEHYFALIYRDGTSGQYDRPKIQNFRFNGNNVEVCGGTYIETGNNSGVNPNIAFNPDLEEFCATYIRAASGGCVVAQRLTATGTGTGITLQKQGTVEVLNNDGNSGVAYVAYHAVGKKYVIVYYSTSGSSNVNGGAYYIGKFGSNNQFAAEQTQVSNGVAINPSQAVTMNDEGRNTIVYDPDSKQVIALLDNASGVYGQTISINVTSTTLESNNFIGIATSTVADGEVLELTTQGGISTALANLKVGKQYYVQHNGSLGVGETSLEPVVEAGIAISETELIVKG